MKTPNAELHLDRFLTLAAENVLSAANISSPGAMCIRQIDDHWLTLLFSGDVGIGTRSVSSLMTNSHIFFRSAVNLVFAGLPTPVYPLLRTSMESALYAAMMATKPELESIWLNRQESAKSKAACRAEFSATKAFKFLELKNPGLAKDCRLLYETYIDYGAHPNINGTFTFVEPVPQNDTKSFVANYLQGNSREVRIAAFQTVQVAEVALHLALTAMPKRAERSETKTFLANFSPYFHAGVFGLK